ncbi:MAG TPA: hypothetical protein VJU86_13435 [Pyrinomonadaceae bacterium]|nr:hypothetical protein [Pyrinomonadaceae bacterium]
MTSQSRILTVIFVLACSIGAIAQGPAVKVRKPVPKVDPIVEARRNMAVSMVTSLAEEARSFRDLMLRARVQARAADVLWETDPEGSKALFRRAWDSAEAAEEEISKRTEDQIKAWLDARGTTSSRQRPSLRREVLRLAAKRDKELGEEFLQKLDDARKREAEKAPVPDPSAGTRRINPDNPPPDMTQRLTLARQLLEDGDIERALQFADPALYPVNTYGMNILDMLHEKNPQLADQRYLSVLARAINDPVADANSVSLLSAYVFTPYLYITVKPDGNSHTRRWNDKNSPPENIPATVRTAFFRTAASILLGPLVEPDLSSSGRLGSYVVITRMLPLYEKYGMDQVAALRARQALLTQDVPEKNRQSDDPIFTRGIVPEDTTRDRVQEALDRVDRAKTSDERDRLYYQAAMGAAAKDHERARELAEKIEEPELRKQLLAYLAFDAMRSAIREKKPDDAIRLSKSMELNNVNRAWGLTEAGGLLGGTEPERAIEVLDNATAEAKRIDQNSPDRVRALIAIVTQFQKFDKARAWGMMDEVIKSANQYSAFTGEDGELTLRVAFKGGGAMTNNFRVENYDLNGLFTSLAQDDFNRAVDLPKGFTGESPRAISVLAIARTVLDKKERTVEIQNRVR